MLTRRIMYAKNSAFIRANGVYPAAYRHMSFMKPTQETKVRSNPAQDPKQVDRFDILLKQERSKESVSLASTPVETPSPLSDAEKMRRIFSSESTPLLIKKFLVYKLMGSDLFINHSLSMINASYQVMGIRTTNVFVNNTVCSLFMSGETIDSLMEDLYAFEKKNINSLVGYAVEGLLTMNETKIQEFYECILESIDAQTVGGREGNFAIKFTGLISMDVLTRLSTSSDIFLYDILALDKTDTLSMDQMEKNLKDCNIDLSKAEIELLFNSMKIEKNSETLSRNDRYSKGHLLALNCKSNELERIFHKICVQSGSTEKDMQIFEKFSEQVWTISEHASDKNCNIYIDAEQTYIQGAIESWGQQLTHEFNRGEKHIIMNGYQSYLKRMRQVITDEVASSKALGHNLGIKLVRGAYMREEREIAASKGIESPVHDTIENTHASYNGCMQHILENITEDGLLMIASHNTGTIEKGKDIIQKLDIKDRRVRFGQLKGFSDQITTTLANEDFKVFKYLPFGPTETVLPYLIRRGQESRQVLREQEFQNQFLKEEIVNRLSPFKKAI